MAEDRGEEWTRNGGCAENGRSHFPVNVDLTESFFSMKELN